MQQKTEGQKSRYLLMVEDTASVAALYRSYLTPLGIDINIVGTGRDAIESLNHR
ncbi:sigma-54-dependent Fis family transcriptional regulator, partial [Vibrio parahaemolyticus]